MLHQDITYVDIPSGNKTLAMLLIAERSGTGPFLCAKSKQRNKNGLLPIEKMLDRRVRRISILNMVTDGSEESLEFFTDTSKDYGNYQAKHRFIIRSSERSTADENKRNNEEKQAKMPELKGLSLRKSLRLLQGAPVELIVVGTGRVVGQYPEAGVSLKSGMQCRLVLKRDAEIQFRMQR